MEGDRGAKETEWILWKRTLGFQAAELQQAVEDEPGAHGIADQDDWAVAVAPRSKDVGQQTTRPLRAMQSDRPSCVNELNAQSTCLRFSHRQLFHYSPKSIQRI